MFEEKNYLADLDIPSDLSRNPQILLQVLNQKEHRKFVAEGVDYLLEQFRRIVENSSISQEEKMDAMKGISSSVFEAAAVEPDPEIKQNYINRLFYAATTSNQSDIAVTVDSKAKETPGLMSPLDSCELALS